MPKPARMERKLSDEQRILVFKMYAEGVMPTEMSKWIKENWAIDYQPDSIASVVRTDRAQPYLKKFKEQYLARVKEVPIANKRIRVDDLELVRLKTIKLLKENPQEA